MENITKALLIAGGIVIALIILSGVVAFYVGLNKSAKKYAEDVEMAKIATYNRVFEKYIGKENVTYLEIFALGNYVNNRRGDISTETKVFFEIPFLQGSDQLVNVAESHKEPSSQIDFLDLTDIGNAYHFDSIEYDENGIVSKIVFRKTRDNT